MPQRYINIRAWPFEEHNAGKGALGNLELQFS